MYGGVRLISDANRERGQFAITVVDTLAGRGIGRRLMDVIIDYAKSIGIRRIDGHVLGSNKAMLKLCGNLGFLLTRGEENVICVRLGLK